MSKQTYIPGTQPERHADFDEVIDELGRLRALTKRTTEQIHKLEAVLVSRMLEHKVARYDYTDDAGGEWSVALDLPEPNLKLKFMGSRNADQ